MAYACYHLAKNPEIQARLRAEVDDAFEAADCVLPDYATIQSLPYLDMVVHETLRLHPPIAYLSRRCVKPYT